MQTPQRKHAMSEKKEPWLIAFSCFFLLFASVNTYASPPRGDEPPLPHSKMINLDAFEDWSLQCHSFRGYLERNQKMDGISCKKDKLVKLHLFRTLHAQVSPRCPRSYRNKRVRQRSCAKMCVNGKLWSTKMHNWKLSMCTLAKPFGLDGASYWPGDVVSFSREGKLLSVRLASKRRAKPQMHTPSHSARMLRKPRVQITPPASPKGLGQSLLLFQWGPYQCHYNYGHLGIVCSD